MTHPTIETLGDLLDAQLPPAGRAEVEAHLRHCAECRETMEALRQLAREAAALPRTMAAPDGLWDEVRGTIEGRRTRKLRPAWRLSPGLAAAAAVVCMAAGSAVTLLVTRESAAPPAGVVRVMPVAWQATEQGYLDNVAALQAILREQQGQLSPETVVAVEQALRTIDDAIAEARSALMRDPSNAALGDLLASNYRQKVELLRRATQLVTS